MDNYSIKLYQGNNKIYSEAFRRKNTTKAQRPSLKRLAKSWHYLGSEIRGSGQEPKERRSVTVGMWSDGIYH